ncbi:Iron-sulfur cluster-binding protein, Rieske family [Cystobacter fuscus DSM 2262]|uniref:Iron-sulfur cluster-binding protein, Rieske family n=1 Tax=Cystobacter fuscus (strain ATCC 25194 / DSM 2262 / NBRC 100088 / M29) TaxID=1242864 RepID=S9QKE6_CYSF2|nr:Iron-sulfur cluster-binding protein, Rieske family [Cystobacter fuscus DSM 2262]
MWTVSAPARRYPPLPGDLEVDVVVVGGGLAGLTTAWLLKQEGKRVAVVEMHRILTGQTGQTTAHLTELLDVSYDTLASDFGEKGARLAAESVRASIEKISSLVERLGIACDFQRLPGYRYAETEDEARQLEHEASAARRAGLLCSLTRDVPLPYPVTLALRVEDQAQFHPRAYLQALAERIVGEGSHVFEETQVTDIHEGAPCRVQTTRGVLLCQEVVEATTTPLNRVLLHTKLMPYRSYALAARLEAPLAPGLYYDSKDPYHYIRTQRVDGADYVIVGGEDHKVGAEEDTARRYLALEEYLRQHFPASRVEYRWSGQIIEPVDGLAYIGRNGGSRHVWVATGFSGTGMTFGTLAGMILSDLILGRDNRYASLYDATRVKPVAGAKDFVQENAEVAFHFVADRLARPDTHDLSDVPPGEGRIVEVEGRKVAVYREASGGVHALSPVCTHLGCHVHWNNAERSWDCPCHGGRYSPTGEVLNGPPVKGLASKKIR